MKLNTPQRTRLLTDMFTCIWAISNRFDILTALAISLPSVKKVQQQIMNNVTVDHEQNIKSIKYHWVSETYNKSIQFYNLKAN